MLRDQSSRPDAASGLISDEGEPRGRFAVFSRMKSLVACRKGNERNDE